MSGCVTENRPLGESVGEGSGGPTPYFPQGIRWASIWLAVGSVVLLAVLAVAVGVPMAVAALLLIAAVLVGSLLVSAEALGT